MYWDEEIAKKEKVCPMTLRISDDDRPRYHKCLGSECMAWRAIQLTAPNVTIRLTNPPEFNVPVQEIKIPAEDIAMPSKGTGYCGLAGPPEYSE